MSSNPSQASFVLRSYQDILVTVAGALWDCSVLGPTTPSTYSSLQNFGFLSTRRSRSFSSRNSKVLQKKQSHEKRITRTLRKIKVLLEEGTGSGSEIALNRGKIGNLKDAVDGCRQIGKTSNSIRIGWRAMDV